MFFPKHTVAAIIIFTIAYSIFHISIVNSPSITHQQVFFISAILFTGMFFPAITYDAYDYKEKNKVSQK